MSTSPPASPRFTDSSSSDWPRISIVTPCYNKSRYIETTIRSVLHQGYPNLEYVIVDGGSNDGSVEIIRRYDDDLTWWVSEPDSGMYDALQKGFERTSGEVLGWINADDLLHRQSLFTVGEIFHKFTRVEWIQGCPTWIDEAGRIVRTAGTLRRWSRYDYYLGNYRWIQQESTFWRRSLWEKAGGYIDTAFSVAGDLDLWARFFRYAPLHVTEAVLGAFRMCREGQLSQTHFETYVEETEDILQRERERLNDKDRGILQKLQWCDNLCNTLARFRLPGVNRVRRLIRNELIGTTPMLRFDREKQSFYMHP